MVITINDPNCDDSLWPLLHTAADGGVHKTVGNANFTFHEMGLTKASPMRTANRQRRQYWDKEGLRNGPIILLS